MAARVIGDEPLVGFSRLREKLYTHRP